MPTKKACLCCGYLTIEEGSLFEICRICRWIDDGLSDDDPYSDVNTNGLSLYDARKNYQLFGAKYDHPIDDMCFPLPEEIPPTGIPNLPPIPPPTREELLRGVKTSFVVDPDGNATIVDSGPSPDYAQEYWERIKKKYP